MKNNHQKQRDKEIGNIWKLFLNTIYFVIFAVVLTIAYLPLRGTIDAYLNRKVYTKEELALLNKQASARMSAKNEERKWDLVENGVHVRTGLYNDVNLPLIISTCTSCHSAKLVTQNRATREGWHSMIKWMQETQGLPDLGASEPVVLDYLAKYYAPEETGRRKNLDVDEIEWFILSLN